MENRKSLFATYILWMFGGGLGLHHFYLGRDTQAFVWWSTFGGFFGLGWLRDLWMIPYYVKLANSNANATGSSCKEDSKVPPFSFLRFLGEVAVGYFYGLLFQHAIAYHCLSTLLISAVESLGTAVGIFLVGNIGQESGNFKDCLLACLMCKTLLLSTGLAHRALIVSFVGALCFQSKRTLKKQKFQKIEFTHDIGFWKRCIILFIGAIFVMSLWGSAVNNPLMKQVHFRSNVRDFRSNVRGVLKTNSLSNICALQMFEVLCNRADS